MMVAATEFQAMRYGLGVTLMTDGYFSNSPVGGSFYGAPTYYTEYEADLGFPKSAARLLLNGTGHGEVWTRYSFSAFYPQTSLGFWGFITKCVELITGTTLREGIGFADGAHFLHFVLKFPWIYITKWSFM